MYLAVVILTMFVLPLGSIGLEHVQHPAAPLVPLVGRWFVFWSVGVRLGLAGLRQMVQPRFTAVEIFHLKSDEALALVTELGVANFAAAVVGLASLWAPSFVLPSAISAGLFYGIAGVRHIPERAKSRNEAVAMISDLFMFLVLAGFVGWTVLGAGLGLARS